MLRECAKSLQSPRKNLLAGGAAVGEQRVCLAFLRKICFFFLSFFIGCKVTEKPLKNGRIFSKKLKKKKSEQISMQMYFVLKQSVEV